MMEWLREIFTTDIVKFAYGFGLVILIAFIAALAKISDWFRK